MPCPSKPRRGGLRSSHIRQGVARPRGSRRVAGEGSHPPRAHATGLLPVALSGLHKVDGFLFVALCALRPLCAGSVAFSSHPKFPSAFSAASAVRSVPLLPLCSIHPNGVQHNKDNPASPLATP